MSTLTPEPSPENIEIAQYLSAIFHGQPQAHGYAHDHRERSVDILSAQGQPEEELCSFSTIGLSDYRMMRGDEEFRARIEVAGLRKTFSLHGS